jgi:hypothetical protein
MFRIFSESNQPHCFLFKTQEASKLSDLVPVELNWEWNETLFISVLIITTTILYVYNNVTLSYCIGF